MAGFFATNPNASELQVMNFAKQLLNGAGLGDVKFDVDLVPYK